MLIINKSGRVRLTWDGKCDIPPDGTIDTSTLTDAEAEWQLRHGFEKVEKPKPEPVPVPPPAPVEEDEPKPKPKPRRQYHRRMSTVED